MQLVVHDSDTSFNAVSIIDLLMRIITIYVSRLMSVVFWCLQKMAAIVLI